MYDYTKAFHISADIVWMSGMILMPMLISIAGEIPTEARTIYILNLRRLVSFIVTPAMIIAWVLGLTLTVSAEWLSSNWIIWKIVLVVILSGLHGFFSGQLRRLANDKAYTPVSRLWVLTPMQIVIVVVVVFLAVVKPG